MARFAQDTSFARESAKVGFGWRRELWLTAVAQATLLLVLVLAWWAAAGRDDAALDDRGTYAGMATAVLTLAGGGLAAWRLAGPRGIDAWLLRWAMQCFLVAALALGPLLLAAAVALLGGGLFWLPLGGAIGLLCLGLGGALLLLFVAGALLGWNRSGPEATVLERLSLGLLMWGMAALSTSAAFAVDVGDDGSSRSRGIAEILAVLGFGGRVVSVELLWVARGFLAVVVLAVLVLVRAQKRPTHRFVELA